MHPRPLSRAVTGTVLSVLFVAATLTQAGPASAAGTWVAVGSQTANALTQSQGVASVEVPAGSANRYTGVGTIPVGVAAEGWNHVGDPDDLKGYYIEPYQTDSAAKKMFRVQAPNGAWSEYVHADESGEAYNNSFDAISPDGQWLVSGEWGTMTRLLVFPAPGLNTTTSPSANLPLAFTINLDHAVRDVQGCDFVTATRLLCSSDDPDGTLFGYPKPLLQVDLSAALSGSAVTGSVTALRQLPLSSACSGTFEVEGIDYDGRDGTLRVIVMSPSICVVFDSKIWRFRLG